MACFGLIPQTFLPRMRWITHERSGLYLLSYDYFGGCEHLVCHDWLFGQGSPSFPFICDLFGDRNGTTSDVDVLVVDGVSSVMMNGVRESLLVTSFCMLIVISEIRWFLSCRRFNLVIGEDNLLIFEGLLHNSLTRRNSFFIVGDKEVAANSTIYFFLLGPRT